MNKYAIYSCQERLVVEAEEFEVDENGILQFININNEGCDDCIAAFKSWDNVVLLGTSE